MTGMNLEKTLLIILMALCLSGFYMSFKSLDRVENFSMSTKMFQAEELNHNAIKDNTKYVITKLEVQNESITALTSLIKTQNDILIATGNFCLIVFVLIFFLCFLVLLIKEKSINQRGKDFIK